MEQTKPLTKVIFAIPNRQEEEKKNSLAKGKQSIKISPCIKISKNKKGY